MDEIDEIARAGFEFQHPEENWATWEIATRQQWWNAARFVKDFAVKLKKLRGILRPDQLGEQAHTGFNGSHEAWHRASAAEKERWQKIAEVMRDKWEELGANE